ncbi:MAG: FAD-dependent oxidoreductase [Myxococcota bacterium]
MSDVIVVGDGPAGLSAALFLAKNGLAVEVYGKNESWVHKALLKNYLGFSRIRGPEFMRLARQQVEDAGGSVIDAEITAILKSDEGFEVQASDGQSSFAKFVILAAGAKTKLASQLGIKTDDKGYVIADRSGRTNVDHLWVAGWSTRADKVQLAISVGDGAAAALDILSIEKGKDFHDFDSLEDDDI